jgi:hypothetical protein
MQKRPSGLIHTFNPLVLGDIADITRLAAQYDSVKVYPRARRGKQLA